MSLSSLIVQREVATMRQVEEALARQVIYGGDLVTNLLEVARVDEAVLTPLLAESMQLAPAPAGELLIPPDPVRALIPAEVAVQRSIVPLDSDGELLSIAVAEPLPADVRDQLGFALGMRVEEMAAPAVRVWQAIARAYGVQLDRRMHRLIGRLSGDNTIGLGTSLPPVAATVPPVAAPAPLPAVVTTREPTPVPVPPSLQASLGAPTPSPTLGSGLPARMRSSRPPSLEGGASVAGALASVGMLGTTRQRLNRRSTLTSFPATRTGTEPGLARASRPEMLAPTAALAVDVDRHALLQRDVAANARPSRRRRGPLTLDAARAEAEDAGHRDALLDLFFDYSRQFFDYAVLFLVQADIAEGRDAFGNGASRDRVLGIGVPLDLPSLLASAREKQAPIVAVAASDGLDAVLLADLHRPRDAEVAVVPLLVRTRAVALLVGDCGEAGIDRDNVRDVVAFGIVIGKAFERIIVRRKLDGFIAGSRGGPLAQVDAASVPVKSQPTSRRSSLPGMPPAAASAFALGPAAARPSSAPTVPEREPPRAGVSSAPTAPESEPARAGRFEDASSPSGDAPAAPTIVASAAPAVPGASNAAPARGRPSSSPPPPANIAVVRTISGPPIPREEPESPPSGPGSLPPASFIPESSGVPASAAAAAAGVPGRVAARSAPDGPELEVGAAPEDDTVLYDAFAHEITGHGPGLAGPPSAAIAVAPHRPPAARAGLENGLPLVMFDFDGELGGLVDRLVAGAEDEAAETELLRQGERAMPALMARFPGPVTFERARLVGLLNPPRASECGVVLRLVARERKVALPFVLDRLTDPDPERRGWATHLLGELAYIEALPHVLERLQDEDAATRASAGLAVAAIARNHPGRVAQSLREMAEDPDPRRRTAAMRAAGEVRDGALVPLLLHGLGDGAAPVVSAAHAALVKVTRQDFGSDARPWMRWWEQNSSRHRLEWLIDALTHEVSEVRRAAGDELRVLSRQYFGFASDLPPRDRERAQQRYRDWWITEGRAAHRRA